MKFSISVADANRLCEIGKANKGCGGNKINYPEKYDLLNCELCGDFLVFQRVNLYSTGVFHIEVSYVEDVESQEFAIAPPTKKFKEKPGLVSVEVRKLSEWEREVVYSTSSESQTIQYRLSGCDEANFDKETLKGLVLEGSSVARVYLNPRLFAEALEPYVSDYKKLEGSKVVNGYVQIDILDGLSGISITNKAGEISRVLPIRPPEEPYKNIFEQRSVKENDK